MRRRLRLIAPVVLIALILAVWGSGFSRHLSLSELAREQDLLRGWVAAHPVAAPCLFLAVYIVSVTLSLPQAVILTMTGGLLFGTLAGGALAVCGATVGAVFLFLIARSALGEAMVRRGGPALARLREDLRANGFSYLLAIRLIPVVPFWLINLAAPLCGMRLRDFAAATVLGILPATFIAASIGAGLGGVLARNEQPDLSMLLSFRVLAPLGALACLSLAPVVWRKWRGARG